MSSDDARHDRRRYAEHPCHLRRSFAARHDRLRKLTALVSSGLLCRPPMRPSTCWRRQASMPSCRADTLVNNAGNAADRHASAAVCRMHRAAPASPRHYTLRQPGHRSPTLLTSPIAADPVRLEAHGACLFDRRPASVVSQRSGCGRCRQQGKPTRKRRRRATHTLEAPGHRPRQTERPGTTPAKGVWPITARAPPMMYRLYAIRRDWRAPRRSRRPGCTAARDYGDRE
jgi:hypothetical protein